MALAFEKPMHIQPARLEQEPKPTRTPKLDISVVFTSLGPTVQALRQAADLARRLNARIILVAPQIVPYPLPLVSPPVLLAFNERRLLVIAGQSHVETTVRIYLCRDREDCVALMLPAHSIVFLGGRKRWWPTSATRLANKLRRAGHEVVMVEAE